MNRPIIHSSQPGDWKLAEDLDHVSDQGSISEEEWMVLPWVVSWAAAGHDPAEHYPAFYEKMLANPELQSAFLDALRALEETAETETLPLQPGGLQVLLEALPLERWRITWIQGLANLQAALFPPPPLPSEAGPALRCGDLALDDVALAILRSQVEAGSLQAGLQVDVFLQAIQKIDEPELFYPVITLALLSSGEDLPQYPAGLQLRLEWGSYQATAELNAQGQASFPPLAWETVLDEDGQQVIAPVSLSVEKITA